MTITKNISFPFPVTFLAHVLTHNGDVLNPYMLKQLAIAVRDDLDEIVLFSIMDSTYVAKVVRADYAERLQELKKQFIAHEQYEFVSVVDRILRKHYANVLIAETRTK